MKSAFSRREYIKLGASAIGGLVLPSGFRPGDQPEPELWGRVTIEEIDDYSEPRDDTSLIVGKRYRDQLVVLYYALEAPGGPVYNPIWYRVWGGNVHSGYLQLVKMNFNPVLENVVEGGQLCEVTVPYTDSFRYDRNRGWLKQYRLYYETTHWVTDIRDGPDGEPWYQITNELDSLLSYHTPAVNLRPIPDVEISPLSPDVPAEDKRIEVSIARQELSAYEGEEVVFNTKIFSGYHSIRATANGIPTHTPKGEFRIQSKSPSKHMGSLLETSGAPGGYTLPGVPWTSFFIPETGVVIHGAYWHNNFGAPMSRGCVNMRPVEAKRLFRWCTPVWDVPMKDRFAWDRRGYGTRVKVY